MQLKRKMLNWKYKKIIKPFLFMFDAETVHNRATSIGCLLGKTKIGKKITASLMKYENNALVQNMLGIEFKNPIGLSAGFDYDANLTKIVSDVGFGFATVGTVTNLAYAGNPKPRLGRLPISKSLLVNKGYKSVGADVIVKKLSNHIFDLPISISIGRSNSSLVDTLEKSIDDIIIAFSKFENQDIHNSYYEINISCPNLIHVKEEVNFYNPNNLEKLLNRIDSLNLKKPVFIKMPITENDKDILTMIEVITKHNVQGVIFGNLEKNRKNPALNQDEVAKCGKGNFSGKPCYSRSNELISLCYKNYKNKLLIIGCGGVFSAEDAYEKIKRGASLVELITGMIYEGPQLIGQINEGLVKLLKKDGFSNISQAIGKDSGLKNI